MENSEKHMEAVVKDLLEGRLHKNKKLILKTLSIKPIHIYCLFTERKNGHIRESVKLNNKILWTEFNKFFHF
jgi:hypothetical protein